MNKNPVSALALIGPTASGKTALSFALAEHCAARGFPIEIISVDSALVYRGMDIGTAKPTADELSRVPHHLIDVIAPTQSYSAADFMLDAEGLMANIRARGRLPVLVGGTMLYVKALLEGLDDLPQADAAIRAEIEQQARDKGWSALHAQLALIDPPTAERLPPTDAQRIGRALEVFALTGQPLSSFFTAKSARQDVALLALMPTDRAWLHQRIALRFEQMMQAGLVDEVRGLMARGDLTLDTPSMRCVGYRQVWETLAGTQGENTLMERGIAATRQLAKRQITWLRSMEPKTVIACDAPDVQAQLLCAVDALGLFTAP
jgi:tRNA dimethylallyltransferase